MFPVHIIYFLGDKVFTFGNIINSIFKSQLKPYFYISTEAKVVSYKKKYNMILLMTKW